MQSRYEIKIIWKYKIFDGEMETDHVETYVSLRYYRESREIILSAYAVLNISFDEQLSE